MRIFWTDRLFVLATGACALVCGGCSKSSTTQARDAEALSDAPAGTGGINGTGGSHGTGGGSGQGGSGGTVGTGGSATSSTGGTDITGSGGAKTGGAGGAGGSRTGGAVGGTGSGGSTANGGSGGSYDGGGSPTDDIGTWIDAPGACPSGMTKIDLTTESDLENATRGEGNHASDPASVCYFIHNGTYVQSGSTIPMFIKKGGADATHRRVFVGESRTGVIVKGRATIGTEDAIISHVQISNLTFDLTGFSQSGSFNTLSLVENSTDLRIDHVTFTGDCKTGANGGHVEVDHSTDVIVEECIIEKFGRCGPNGHQDHGVYLAVGNNLTIRNNDIRGNASRGIQFNTEGGDFGTLDNIVIERNRIHDNGHSDYEDGIVMNATGTGTISNVTIQRNLIYGNYYSGIREAGDVFKSVVIRNNTFYANGTASSGSGRSELNLDDEGSGAATSVTRNIIVAANRILNNCYDSQPRGYALTDNIVQGTAPSGTAGNCISGSTSADPVFSDAATGNFHTQNAAVSGYGAYAP
jgi:hypothetical protein